MVEAMRVIGCLRLNSRSKSAGGTDNNRRGKWRSGKLGVLTRRNFRRFYVGYATSLLGTSMSAVAIAFAVASERRCPVPGGAGPGPWS